MKINLFQNFDPGNFFFQERFLEKKPSQEIKLATVQFEKRGGNEDLDSLKKEVNTQKPTPKKQLDSLKKDLDKGKKNQERKKTVTVEKKRLEEKHGENLKPYVDRVKEAFIGLKKNPGKLYEFLMECRVYKKFGHYKKWNEQFATLLGLPLNSKNSNEKEYALYAGAMQLYLLEGVFKENVFKRKNDRRANTFAKMDDKIGAYTVNVLTAYWNQKFSKKSFEFKGVTKVHGKLDYSTLGESYSEKNKNAFRLVMDDLDRMLKVKKSARGTGGEKSSSSAVEKNKAQKPTETNKEKLPDKYAKYASRYMTALKKAIKDKADKLATNWLFVAEESAAFQKEFNKCLSILDKKEASQPSKLEDWIKVFKEAKADLNILVPGYLIKKTETPSAKKTASKKPEKKELSPEKKKRKKLIDTFAVGALAYGKTFWNDHASQHKDNEKSLKNLLDDQYEPETFTNLDDESGSWVGKEYKKYETLYKSLPGTADSKKGDPELKKAYDKVKKAVADYHTMRWNALKELNRFYEQKARRMVSKMDLPDGFGKIDYKENFWSETESMARRLRQAIDYHKLWRGYVRKEVMTHYFNLKDVPTRTFKNWDELTGKLKKGFLDSAISYFGKGNKEAALKRVNDIILYNNLQNIRGGKTKNSIFRLQTDYKKDVDRVMGIVDRKYNLYTLKGLAFTEDAIKTEIRKIAAKSA